MSCSHMHSLHTYQHPRKSGAFLTIDEPTLTFQSHPKSLVYVTIHSQCCTFMGLGKFITICIHYYSIMQHFLLP